MRIPIVDENDEIIKIIDIKDKKPQDISRICSLWVTNEKGEILLAQRSFKKEKHPGKWGPAVAGKVEEGETYEQSIIREAKEEIGLINIKPKKELKRRISETHEYFGQWFSVVVDSQYPFTKQDSEVEKIQWFTKDEIIKKYTEDPNSFVPSFYERLKYFF